MAGRKRANGEGTIYRRADGRYEGAAVVPVLGGARRRVRVYAGTRKEARSKLDRVIDEARQGIPRPTQKLTVGGYLDYWLEHVVKPELRPTSYTGYEIMLRRPIKPVLGRKYLVDLSPADRPAPARGAAGQGDRRSRRRPARTVAAHGPVAHAVLRNALSNGVREELVTRNVAKMVRTSNPEYEGRRRPRPALRPCAARQHRRGPAVRALPLRCSACAAASCSG